MNRRTRWSGGLFGFALGCMVTLGLIAAQDHGGTWLPSTREVGAAPATETTRSVFLAGCWSTELRLSVDGAPVSVRAVAGGASAVVPSSGKHLEVSRRSWSRWLPRVHRACFLWMGWRQGALQAR
jgi:hypothetical protein